MDLTLDEKTNGAIYRAKLKTAEEHFFKEGQPHFPLGFSVGYRNPGHWDIFAIEAPGRVKAFLSMEGNRTSENEGGRERAFRIRGLPGYVTVHDERWDPTRPFPRPQMVFKSVSSAMLWIADELMQEPKP